MKIYVMTSHETNPLDKSYIKAITIMKLEQSEGLALHS